MYSYRSVWALFYLDIGCFHLVMGSLNVLFLFMCSFSLIVHSVNFAMHCSHYVIFACAFSMAFFHVFNTLFICSFYALSIIALFMRSLIMCSFSLIMNSVNYIMRCSRYVIFARTRSMRSSLCAIFMRFSYMLFLYASFMLSFCVLSLCALFISSFCSLFLCNRFMFSFYVLFLCTLCIHSFYVSCHVFLLCTLLYVFFSLRMHKKY